MVGKTPSLELSDEDKAYFESGGEEPAATPSDEPADTGSDDGEAERVAAEAAERARDPKTGKFAKTEGADPGDKTAKDKVEKPVLGEVVDKKALDAERNARKQADRAHRETKERLERLDKEFRDWQRSLLTRQEPEQTAQPEIDLGPDPETDPIGAMKWAREQRARDLQMWRNWEAQQATQQAEQTKTQATQEAEAREFYRDFNAASEDWADAVTVRPELGQVRNALLNSFAMEFNFQEGLSGPELTKRVLDHEKSHAVYAKRRGIPIDEYLVRLAASRNIGVPQAQQAEQRPTPGQANGQAPQQAPNNGAAELERLARAQEASTTLSSAGGSPGGGGVVSLEAFDRMTTKERQEFISKLNRRDPHGFDKFMEKGYLGR
jgi:hypothetical protein